MPEAKKHLATITDAKVRKGLQNALERLREEPDKRGKGLRDDLIGFRSLRAVGERYRIVYQVLAEAHDTESVWVLVIHTEGIVLPPCAALWRWLRGTSPPDPLSHKERGNPQSERRRNTVVGWGQ